MTLGEAATDTIRPHPWNERGSYLYWTERAEELLEGDGRRRAVTDLAGELEEELEAALEASDAIPVFREMLTDALRATDWRELAEEWVDHAEEGV